jgi:dienelactone hydrolase
MSIESAPEIMTANVEYPAGEVVCEGFIAHAASSSRRPCVAIVHAWDGINDVIRAKAREFAQLGYVGLALDVYGQGVRGGMMDDNSHLMMPFLHDRGLLRERLLAGIDAARAHEQIDPDRILVMGYCFGGLCALDVARSGAPGVRGAISIHGLLKRPEALPLTPIDAKVLVLHGWSDPMVPPQDVLALAQEMTQAGADWQLHAYGHALHAFTLEGANKPERGIGYHPAAARRADIAVRELCRELFDS